MNPEALIMNETKQKQDWQQRLSNCVRDLPTLCKLTGLNLEQLEKHYCLIKNFPLRAPREFVQRIKQGDINDPLLKQILPIQAELNVTPGYSHDPLAEQNKKMPPGILHKYYGRVLLMINGNCAIHCRYCFRREFPYNKQSTLSNWQPALDYIEKDSSIKEVILSGGDPLILKDEQLQKLIAELNKIPHLKRLRIHSRIPVVLPQRMTNNLINIINSSKMQTILVIHCNHSQEIDSTVANKLKSAINSGIMVFNQTVLLKGINDSSTILAKLSEDLFAIGVIPYYLHVLDKVSGTAHFDIGKKQVQHIMAELLKALPGYLVPKCVREIPGKPAKVPMNFEF